MKKELNESSIRKILKNEAVTVIWIIGLVFGITKFVVIPQQQTSKDIALINESIKKIEENHLTHLQNYAEEIKDIKVKQEAEDKEQVELMKAITTINAKLNLK